MYHTVYMSPIGPLRIVADDIALRQLWLPVQVENQPINAGWTESSAHPLIQRTIALLTDYFAGKRVCFKTLPCQPEGTEFQRAIWQALRQIDYGQTACYGDIAAAVNRPKGAQAAGGAIGANPIAIIVPCHRVLGRNTTLTGYTGGLHIKKALLDLEGIRYKENG